MRTMNEKFETFWGLPPEVKYCTKCTVSNQRPNSVIEFLAVPGAKKATIDFDENGVCSACRYSEIKNAGIDWQRREAQLKELCEKFRSRNGSYDCVIPGSGGKDSAFTSHILKYKYGMNPLTVTWAPHKYTEIGWENFQNWIHSGLDNILFTPNGRVHSELTRLAFEKLVHPFQPFIIGQRLVGPRMAALHKIPLVFYGENQAEYGNKIEENEKPIMNTAFYSDQPDVDSLFLGGVSVRELETDYGISKNELNPYMPIDGRLLKEVGAEVHYLGYYLKWDPQECYYYAVENTGFQANPERTEGSYSKYSSIDDQIDPLHYYTTLIKFGIGRATYDSSQEVRNGKITREEGVALIRKFDTEFPTKYFKSILSYMKISEERFWEVIDGARSPHLWEKVGKEWKLRHQIE
jgi:N-acetyl sugar amidotransferase